MSSSKSVFRYEPSADKTRAALRIDASERSEHSVSPYLTGKFCEHLGSNIYNGMEAQILANPTFGRWRFSAGDRHPNGGVIEAGDAEAVRKSIEHVASRYGMDDVSPLVDAYEHGCAFGWFAMGERSAVSFSPDAGPHGERAQRVEIIEGKNGPDGMNCGVGQSTYMPLHRTRSFAYRIVARAAAATKIEIRVAPGRDAEAIATASEQLGTDWTTITGCLELPQDCDRDRPYIFSIVAGGPANIVIDRALLYPSDHRNGADPDVVRMLRESHLPLLRWPGGNFVSGYRWRDGVGPIDARPTKPNPAWDGLEYNLFGTHEFLAFCEEVGCEPLICVNAGDGTPEEAAAWVEYCNGPADSPMGALRAKNGRAAPWGVRIWEIGNELYGPWQVGWTTPGGNADRYRRFRAAMLAADPSLELMGCGSGNEPLSKWNDTLIREAGESLTCITDHILTGGSVGADTDADELMGAYAGSATILEKWYAELRSRMVAGGSMRPQMAITELQLFCFFNADSEKPGTLRPEQLPRQDKMAEAIYFASIALMSARMGDFMRAITHSATVNHGGGLRKVRERVFANPVHHAHALFAPVAGAVPVSCELRCGTYSTSHVFGNIPALKDVPDLDACAVLSSDDKQLTVVALHRSASAGPVDLEISLDGFDAAADAAVLTLAGESWHDRNTVDEPHRVGPKESMLQVKDNGLALKLEPFSIVRVTLQRRG